MLPRYISFLAYKHYWHMESDIMPMDELLHGLTTTHIE